MKTNNLSRIVVILMLVLMGSAQAMAQGDKLKKVSYAKSGDLLEGEQLYVRTRDAMSTERGQGYAPVPWILYLENGGSVDLKLPNFEQFGEFHNYGSNKGTSLSGDVLSGLKPDFYSFSYYVQDENEKEKEKRRRFIHVRVVPYAVPYLGELRLHNLTTSGGPLVRLTSPDPEGHEEFYQYTINSDNDLKLLTMNTSPGPAYLMMSQSIPTQRYWYGENLASQVDFAKGVSVDQLKQIAVSQGFDPKDFVVQVGIYGNGGLIYSDIYRDKAKGVVRLTWIRIIDKRPQIKKVTLTTQISPAGAGEVLINKVSQSSIQVDQGTQVHLKARVTSQGYVFDHWADAAGQSLGTDSLLSYVVEENTTLTVHFKKKEFEVKASSNDLALGSVEPATLKVKAGGEASFTATAKENAIFKGWKKGTAEVSVTESVLKLTNVQEASKWTAVFEKKASTPEVGAVDLQFGQREAILTWAPGSATSWQIKFYRSDTKLVKTILTQLPRVELESLIPGEVYRYELVAKRQGKLDSQVKQGTFKTDQFNEREALAPYLKNFSKLLRGKAFDLIWMDVNLSEFDQETPIYEYYWQLNETSPKVLLIPDGKQLTLDTNQVGGCLIILIKSGDTLLYEVRYELDK